MIGDVLRWFGLSGSIVLVVSVAIALWHGRRLLLAAAALGTWLRAAGLIAIGIALAAAGFVPGVRLNINVAALANAVTELWQALPVNKLLRRLPLG